MKGKSPMSCGSAFQYTWNFDVRELLSWSGTTSFSPTAIATGNVQSRNNVSQTSLQCKLEPFCVGSCRPGGTVWIEFFEWLVASVVHFEWKAWSNTILVYEQWPGQIQCSLIFFICNNIYQLTHLVSKVLLFSGAFSVDISVSDCCAAPVLYSRSHLFVEYGRRSAEIGGRYGWKW